MNDQNVVKELSKSAKRLTLYKELDGDNISYEAKFKHKKNRYSVEFDIDGVIEDIEMIEKKKSLPMKPIESYLKANYNRTRLIKIQKQFIKASAINDIDFLIQVLNGLNGHTINFEIITEVRTESSRDIVELLFTENGEFIKSRILKPSSYEHIMY